MLTSSPTPPPQPSRRGLHTPQLPTGALSPPVCPLGPPRAGPAAGAGWLSRAWTGRGALSDPRDSASWPQGHRRVLSGRSRYQEPHFRESCPGPVRAGASRHAALPPPSWKSNPGCSHHRVAQSACPLALPLGSPLGKRERPSLNTPAGKAPHEGPPAPLPAPLVMQCSPCGG